MTGKIFARTTQKKNSSKTPKSEKSRKRNTIINFRVTPDEKKRIDARIAITGLSRSKFFIESCLYQTVLVKGSVRTFREFEQVLKQFASRVDKTIKLDDMDAVQQESLRMILEILYKLFGKT